MDFDKEVVNTANEIYSDFIINKKSQIKNQAMNLSLLKLAEMIAVFTQIRDLKKITKVQKNVV